MSISKVLLLSFISLPCLAEVTDFTAINNFSVGSPIPYEAQGNYTLKINAHIDGAIAYEIGTPTFISETYRDNEHADGPGYCRTLVKFDAGDDAYLTLNVGSKSVSTHLYFEGFVDSAAPCVKQKAKGLVVSNVELVFESKSKVFGLPVSNGKRLSLAIDLKSNTSFALQSDGTAKMTLPLSIHHAQISYIGPFSDRHIDVQSTDFTANTPGTEAGGTYSELYTEKEYQQRQTELHTFHPIED